MQESSVAREDISKDSDEFIFRLWEINGWDRRLFSGSSSINHYEEQQPEARGDEPR